MEFKIGDIVHLTNKYKKASDDIGIVINITSHCYPEYLFYVDFGNSVGAYTSDDLELVGEISDNAIINRQLKKRGLTSMKERQIVKVEAKTKEEAVNALKLMLDIVRNSEYDGWIAESIIYLDDSDSYQVSE